MAIVDYHSGCGDQQLSFLQLLASSIYGSDDLAGVTHYRINTLSVSGDCEDLKDFYDCDLNHISPERNLAENLFAVDDCANLGLKLFVNSSQNYTDHSTDCGFDQQNLWEMLERCIVGYTDIAGVTHYRLNVIENSGYCDEYIDLIDCDVNDIEAERLLVNNLFALDECDRLAIKITPNLGSQEQGTATDYNVDCFEISQSFIQLLARCLVSYEGIIYLNVLPVSDGCQSMDDFWTCNNNHIAPHEALIDNVFAVDACDHFAIKILQDSNLD